jgi:hypothetical protein
MAHTNLMNKIISALIVVFTMWLICPPNVKAAPFPIVSAQTKVSIVYAKGEVKLDSIAATLLASDIQRVTGYLPLVLTDVTRATGNVIMIGAVKSKLISSLNDSYFNKLIGQWECYSLKVIPHPFKNIDNALVIAGSDARGTAYGVFAISEKMGFSPWYWWADVQPDKKTTLAVDIETYTSQPPSVKYRGIFINDEDWGLQPWAAKTFEPETGDIGPKTYARVFELLLRLKANLIWPAMHPSTKAFYHYPGNVKVAGDYQIVVGSSHAEPMLRNNVGEWDEKTMGHFNYVTNQQKVDEYWESRVKESANFNGIYSMGMRGVHDSGIEGVKTVAETVPLLERIFVNERNMLKKYVNPDVTKVPQVFTPYKEVLDVYDAGLKVPDDITLVWPDDNYGYIQRLSNPTENKRPGGAGVYYHISYWGRPHDYLWLSTTHPALIREEMMKAYELNARNLWVLNVGDIKPSEYNIQMFMDMAYNAQPFAQPAYVKSHLYQWYGQLFGRENGAKIGDVMWKYYDLAFERKPEFMGWSRTEPTTKTTSTEYNANAYGDQAQQRIDAYDSLEQKVKELAKTITENRKDAFYELVNYPVAGASLMNKKFLYRDKADLYAQLGGICAADYARLSNQAYQGIKEQTNYYNNTLAGGKWRSIMSMEPRKLPVYEPAESKRAVASGSTAMRVIAEGSLLRDSAGVYQVRKTELPAFSRWNKQGHFIDLVLQKATSLNYIIKATANWIKVPVQGSLSPATGKAMNRVWVGIDWQKAPKTLLAGSVIIATTGRQDTITVKADNRDLPALADYKGYIAANDHITMDATGFFGSTNNGNQKWQVIEGLGSGGKALEALPLTFEPTAKAVDTAAVRKAASVTYNFYMVDKSPATFTIITLPTAAVNSGQGVRYAVSIDNGPLKIIDFKTGSRSEEWKKNVLSNTAQRKIPASLEAGKHTLTIYMIDPGVIVDRLEIDPGNRQPYYGRVSNESSDE